MSTISFNLNDCGKVQAKKTHPCKGGCETVIQKGVGCYELTPNAENKKARINGEYCSQVCAGRAIWKIIDQLCVADNRHNQVS